MTKPWIVAVVVTYNRRELLLECLAALESQTHRPDDIVVVDNASTDGTPDAVRVGYPDVHLVAAQRNGGGAGGFALGIADSMDRGAYLIWVMDDDTVAQPDALRELLRTRELHPYVKPAVIASRVNWIDGVPHPMNTPRTKPMASRTERYAAMLAGALPIRSASFVSILLDAQAVAERGLPVADYFLWNDDFEYTARLLRDSVGLLCARSVVVHKTATFGGADADPGARFYFEVRNKVWMLLRSDALRGWERGIYAGSTLRRWGRTVARSQQRDELLRCLHQGVIDGVLTRPRPTEQVLATLAPPAEARVRT
jgi:GT2 family glycosyltransferase